MPTIKQVLRRMDLGNSVAEFDDALERYFVETETFRSVVRDRGDIVAGDKGTGKTAMFRILQDRYRAIPELADVELLTGFNPEGTPIFERLAEGRILDEGQYITIWKAYLLSLVGNWILGIYEGALSESMSDLSDMLDAMGLRSIDDKPTTVFNRLVNLYRRVTDPDAVEVTLTITPHGIPIVSGRIELGEGERQPERQEIPHREALSLLNSVLEESGIRAWVVLDRLDEAFQAYPALEIPALRALLRTFLDIQEFDQLRLKLFLRNDLFRRIIGPGFVNLTHVNARRIDIVWDDEDLLDLLGRRIAENRGFLEDIGVDPSAATETLIYGVFPPQVDVGERKPTTIAWILSRIRDGNGVKAPRNLIDLVQKAQEAQLRREERESEGYEEGKPLIDSDAIKRGLKALSEARVEDTLLAEASPELSRLIERFRDGKAEHNEESLAATMGIAVGEIGEPLKQLMQVGFLEQVGSSYKVPMLYRDGLNITQGKAF